MKNKNKILNGKEAFEMGKSESYNPYRNKDESYSDDYLEWRNLHRKAKKEHSLTKA